MPATALRRRFHGFRSLYVVLSSAFILQIIAAVGLVAYFSYQNGLRAVNDLAGQVQIEVIARVNQYLEEYLSMPQLINRINQQALAQGLLNPADLDRTIRYFHNQGTVFPGYGAIFFTNPQGQMLGVNDSEQYIVVADAAEPGYPLRRYAIAANGLRGPVLVERTGYDARTRAFYQAALAAGAPTWSAIALTGASNRLDISAVAPTWNAAGQFQGVFAVDASLELISRFLASLPVGYSGQIFVMDRQGLLVATSTSEPLYVVTDPAANTVERVAAIHSQQPMVAAAAQYLAAAAAKAPAASAPAPTRQRLFESQSVRYFLNAIPYHDAYGLDWQIVVVVPEADFTGRIEENTRLTVWLSLIILAGAALVSLLTARWITRPILRLTEAVEQVTGGNLSVALRPTQRSDEIGVLAHSFQHMVEQMRHTYGALKDSEQQLASIIDFLPDPTFVINVAGEVIAWNHAMEALTGRPAAEVLGRGNYEHSLAFHHELRPALADLALRPDLPPPDDFTSVRRTADGGVEGEGFADTPGGGRRDIYVRAAPLYDAQGRLAGAVEILRDITDSKRAAEEIRQLNLSLERRVGERTAELDAANRELNIINIDLSHAVRSRDEFLAAMSHELRTPLTSILGLAEAMQLEVYGPLSDRLRKSAGHIYESGQHLLALINDILDLSKVEAGKIDLEVRPVAVRDVCLASMRLISEQAHKKKLKVTFSPDLAVATLRVDERRLKQILVNLLGNAVKFTPEGGAVGLDVTGDRQAQVVAFTVWDTGIGIAPDLMPKLFKPFVQLDSRLARAYEGTGLGLALVSRLTELHGGSVTLESEGVPGRGCRFTVTLPWTPADSAPEGWAAPERGAAPDRGAAPGGEARPPQPALPGCILVVDDNETQLAYLADTLASLGSRVETARSGQAALDRARELHPDLIVMDIQMPGMDGLEAIQRLRADPAFVAIPVIALTALVMPGDRERCLAAGASEYLSKPVNLAAMVKLITKLCPPPAQTPPPPAR